LCAPAGAVLVNSSQYNIINQKTEEVNKHYIDFYSVHVINVRKKTKDIKNTFLLFYEKITENVIKR